MKILLQYTFQTPRDWVEIDHARWASLAKKPLPLGSIDNAPGWCHGLNVQGRVFQADHYHVAPLPDGVQVTAWNDGPLGERYARVVNFFSCAPDPHLGGAINTRQRQVVFAERVARDRMSAAIGTTFRDWTAFTPPAADVMHGIQVSDSLHLEHRSVRSESGWREWTEGLVAEELDENGHIRQQRPQGRFAPATGTRTYFMQAAARASGVHVATDEVAFETTADSSSVTEGTANSSDELSFLFTTPATEPNSSAWPTGTYRCSVDVATIDVDMEVGLLTLGGSAGHFSRVNAGLTADQESGKAQTQAAITSTGITVVDTGSVSWSSGAASDRFECLFAQRNTADMGGPQTVTFTCDADAFADGPWAAAPAPGPAIPISMYNYRKRRV